jgi:hypothetical protein
MFGCLVIFLSFTWPSSEGTRVAKFWRFPNHFFLSCVVECGNTALLALDKKFGRDYPVTTEDFERSS